MKLTDFKILTFDCYGTLIDWERGILCAIRPLVDRSGLRSLDGDAVLEAFASEEAAQEQATPFLPYSQLLALVYQRLATRWRTLATAEEANVFGASVPDWPAFDDSSMSLKYLKRYFKLVILSNVDRCSFRGSNARLGVHFDAVYTAEDIGAYKPSLKNFQYMLGHLERDFGVGPANVLHTAQSLFHDHAPANTMGLASAWIDRRHSQQGWGATPPPPISPRYDFRFDSMEAFAAAHRCEVAER